MPKKSQNEQEVKKNNLPLESKVREKVSEVRREENGRKSEHGMFGNTKPFSVNEVDAPIVAGSESSTDEKS